MNSGAAQEFGKAVRSRTLPLAFSIKVFSEHYSRSGICHEEMSGFLLGNHNLMRGRSFWVWSCTWNLLATKDFAIALGCWLH